MARTARQSLGDQGEAFVAKLPCPRCKRQKTLKRLPPNFKCADIICDFCGYLAQVKTSKQVNVEALPKTVLGAAWAPQAERMDAGVYFPLFIVLVSPTTRANSVWYLPSDLQKPEMFEKRNPLGPTARRAVGRDTCCGWTFPVATPQFDLHRGERPQQGPKVIGDEPAL